MALTVAMIEATPKRSPTKRAGATSPSTSPSRRRGGFTNLGKGAESAGMAGAMLAATAVPTPARTERRVNICFDMRRN